MTELKLTRVDLRSALSAVSLALYKLGDGEMTSRELDLRTEMDNPVYELHVWDRNVGPANVGFTEQGIGISRRPDAVLIATKNGWSIPSREYEGVWDVVLRNDLPFVANADLVAAVLWSAAWLNRTEGPVRPVEATPTAWGPWADKELDTDGRPHRFHVVHRASRG